MSEFKMALKAEYLKPGEMVKVEVASIQMLIGNVNGEFYAVSNICPHSKRPIVEHKGSMNENQVKCPHHGSVFDVTTGDVVKGLATECLPKYAVRVEGENVLVEVDG
jgi:3-phenylpropionate/trans-cinnamate dioxygenase ferredoxin subunit